MVPREIKHNGKTVIWESYQAKDSTFLCPDCKVCVKEIGPDLFICEDCCMQFKKKELLTK